MEKSDAISRMAVLAAMPKSDVLLRHQVVDVICKTPSIDVSPVITGETSDGQASYHYDVDPYWDMFQCKELEYAPEWDGHTPAQAIVRIGKLEPVRHGRWIQNKTIPAYYHCSICRATHKMHASCNKYVMLRYCPYCGAKMDEKEDAHDSE